MLTLKTLDETLLVSSRYALTYLRKVTCFQRQTLLSAVVCAIAGIILEILEGQRSCRSLRRSAVVDSSKVRFCSLPHLNADQDLETSSE